MTFITTAGLALPDQLVAGEYQIDLRLYIPLSHRHLQRKELKLFNNNPSSSNDYIKFSLLSP